MSDVAEYYRGCGWELPSSNLNFLLSAIVHFKKEIHFEITLMSFLSEIPDMCLTFDLRIIFQT